MNNFFRTLTVIGDKVKNTTSAREGLNGTTPDETTYSPWTHVFDPSTNALKTSEELGFFTFVVIMFFVLMFAIIYNIMYLFRIFRNLDGSVHQTSHIARKVIVLILFIIIEVFILKYIIAVAASGAVR